MNSMQLVGVGGLWATAEGQLGRETEGETPPKNNMYMLLVFSQAQDRDCLSKPAYDLDLDKTNSKIDL